jgi:hypothetical protein
MAIHSRLSNEARVFLREPHSLRQVLLIRPKDDGRAASRNRVALPDTPIHHWTMQAQSRSPANEFESKDQSVPDRDWRHDRPNTTQEMQEDDRNAHQYPEASASIGGR